MAFSLEVRRRVGRVDRPRDAAELARIVPDLQPRVLHQIVSQRGLDDEDLGFLSGLGATLADDVAASREERRESEGYVTPVMAEAFLASARGLRLETMPAPPPWDRVTTLWFRGAERSGDLHARRMEELGFVANALVAGASLQGRRFRPSEAARAAAAGMAARGAKRAARRSPGPPRPREPVPSGLARPSRASGSGDRPVAGCDPFAPRLRRRSPAREEMGLSRVARAARRAGSNVRRGVRARRSCRPRRAG